MAADLRQQRWLVRRIRTPNLKVNPTLTLEPVTPDSAALLDAFFIYLREHVAENGAPGTGYFQPLPRASSAISVEWEERFRNALAVDVPQPGWRRLWIARSLAGSIAGHVDLRSHAEGHAAHRCVLGMGVHAGSRSGGVGLSLLVGAKQWARTVARLDWIDLQVLSSNEAVRRLYRRFGFDTVGEIPEMFEVDGQRFGYIYMTRRLSRAA